MPIYEYVCSACAHRAEILHGIFETGPNFCPACGAEATMRKGIAAPAVVFKGSGWAKMDRRTAARSSSKDSKDGASESKEAASESKDGGSESKPADSSKSTPSADGASSGSAGSGRAESGSGSSGSSKSGPSKPAASPASEGG